MKPRFSTLTFLLITALIACGVAIWRLQQELSPLREEVQQWRNEAGRLAIDDPTKMHAIYRDPYQEDTWRWRLYLPGEASYWVCCSANRVPRAGYPDRQFVECNGLAPGGFSTPRGEYELTVALRPRTTGGFALAIESKVIKTASEDARWSGLQSSIDLEQHGSDWPEQRGKTRSTVGDQVETRRESADGRLLLLRHRVYRDASLRSNPSEGLMIWLEPMNRKEAD